jgi:hypothetical protein
MPSPRGGNRDTRGVRQDMCVNVTYDFDVKNKTINVCELQWEPRAVEEVIARCVAGKNSASRLIGFNISNTH